MRQDQEQGKSPLMSKKMTMNRLEVLDIQAVHSNSFF